VSDSFVEATGKVKIPSTTPSQANTTPTSTSNEHNAQRRPSPSRTTIVTDKKITAIMSNYNKAVILVCEELPYPPPR
jgi:hypothetical protein